MPQVGVGQKIPLYVYLEDRRNDLFPRARVKDPTGAEITGSPVAMNSIGDGSYVNATLDMPDVNFVVAEFVIYDDALFSVESVTHFPTAELYEKDRSAQILETSVVSQINQISPPGAAISVDLSQSEVEADLSGEPLGTEIDQDKVTADLSDNALSIEIEDEDTINTNVKDC